MPQASAERKFQLLVVDDEPLVLETLGDILTQEGYRVYLAQSGSAARDILRQNPIDMIISDYNMPVMNGDALLNIAKKEFPQTVRVMISGYADLDVVITCLNEEIIQRFFPKPFNVAELTSSVRQLLKTSFGFEEKPLAKHTILLVEDSKYFRNLLIKLLKPRYNLVMAEDGIQGINLAKTSHPDLVITGLNLFGINGVNYINFLRLGLKLSCPIIVWEHLNFVDPKTEASLLETVFAVVDKSPDKPETLLEKISLLL